MFLPQAISQDAKAPVAVLDNRAATYSKLGNLRAALNDGRQMIQQEKSNCSVLQKHQSTIANFLIFFQGYLRTGKILQLQGNHKMALDLYEMGTRKVPFDDPNFKVYSR